MFAYDDNNKGLTNKWEEKKHTKTQTSTQQLEEQLVRTCHNNNGRYEKRTFLSLVYKHKQK